MNNGWTGGQYSLFRAIFGFFLSYHFMALVPWGTETFSRRGVLPDAQLSPLIHAFPNVLAWADTPVFVGFMLVSASLAGVLFALGKLDRVAALWIWYVLACLHGRNPLTANPSLPFLGWMLLAHVFLTPAPYGSLAAARRTNPGKQWNLNPRIFLAAWIIMSLAYSYSGYTKLAGPSWLDGSALRDVLENPLARDTVLRPLLLSLPPLMLQLATWGALLAELAFAPLAAFSRVRPWLWLAMLCLHGGLIVLVDFAELSLGMILLHGFTFDPAWVRRKIEPAGSLLFYDGHCGLCHRGVRFVLSEDAGRVFRFARLQGETFRKTLPNSERKKLLDSIVVQTPDRGLLTESKAVVYILSMLGGYWRVLGVLLKWVPPAWRDRGYRLVAARRQGNSPASGDTCPPMPPESQALFLP